MCCTSTARGDQCPVAVLLRAVGGDLKSLSYSASDLLPVDEGSKLEPAALAGCGALERLSICGECAPPPQ